MCVRQHPISLPFCLWFSNGETAGSILVRHAVARKNIGLVTGLTLESFVTARKSRGPSRIELKADEPAWHRKTKNES